MNRQRWNTGTVFSTNACSVSPTVPSSGGKAMTGRICRAWLITSCGTRRTWRCSPETPPAADSLANLPELYACSSRCCGAASRSFTLPAITTPMYRTEPVFPHWNVSHGTCGAVSILCRIIRLRWIFRCSGYWFCIAHVRSIRRCRAVICRPGPGGSCWRKPRVWTHGR